MTVETFAFEAVVDYNHTNDISTVTVLLAGMPVYKRDFVGSTGTPTDDEAEDMINLVMSDVADKMTGLFSAFNRVDRIEDQMNQIDNGHSC